MSAVPETGITRFRPMSEEDLAAVHANETLAYSHPWTLGIFRDCLRSGYSCWVAEAGGMIVGHGVVSAAVGETHILNVCIAPEWQGRGFGRTFLRHLLDVSREYGALMAFLEVRVSNSSAIRLYESMGFSEVGRRRDYYPGNDGGNGKGQRRREDAIVMALGLDDRDIDSAD